MTAGNYGMSLTPSLKPGILPKPVAIIARH